MRMEPRIGPEGRDDELTRALRELQAPAGGEAFWEALERRILARVASTEDDIWWRQFARWRRGLALAGAAAVRHRGDSPRITPIRHARSRHIGRSMRARSRRCR